MYTLIFPECPSMSSLGGALKHSLTALQYIENQFWYITLSDTGIVDVMIPTSSTSPIQVNVELVELKAQLDRNMTLQEYVMRCT